MIKCLVYGARTNWLKIYITPLCFSFTTISLLESTDLVKIFYTSPVSIGALHIAPLIFENPSSLCIIAIFLSKIFEELIHEE